MKKQLKTIFKNSAWQRKGNNQTVKWIFGQSMIIFDRFIKHFNNTLIILSEMIFYNQGVKYVTSKSHFCKNGFKAGKN